jgi:hypothetical protein
MVIGSQQAVGLYTARFSSVATGTVTQPSRAAASKAVADKVEVLSSNRDPVETLSAGFGEGSVSVPTVAIRTLGRGIEGARQVVPTLEELQGEYRARLAAQREAQAETLQKRDTSSVDVQLSRSAQQAADQTQTQGFMNGLNETAKAAQTQGFMNRLNETAKTAQTQGFTNRLNETAKTAQVPIKSDIPTAQGPTGSARVNGQALDYIRAQTSAETEQSPTFNVLI